MRLRRRQKLLVGTVRAVEGDRHVVVRADGSRVAVRFEGGIYPRLGEDVIGKLEDGSDVPVMTLARSVTEAIMNSKAVIAPVGDPNITARMLARVLAGSRSATLRPGHGACIERTPSSDDADVLWAMDAIGPEMEGPQGIALNVVDVRAIAAAPWTPDNLKDSALPADAEGEGGALAEMRRLLNTGFHPGCHGTIDAATGSGSINFVMPYSPFAGAWGFARRLSGMDRGRYLQGSLTASEARRLSSAREMAKAIAGILRHGPATPSESTLAWRRHRANCFADAFAVLVFLDSGGRPEAARLFADLKESSLAFLRKPGTGEVDERAWEEATHCAIRAAINGFESAPAGKMAQAAEIACMTAMTEDRFHGLGRHLRPDESRSAEEAAARATVDAFQISDEERAAFRQEWLADFRDAIAHLSGPDGSISEGLAGRLPSFAGMHVPFGMEAAFDEECAKVEARAYPHRASVAEVASDKGRLAGRIKAIASPADDDSYELEGMDDPRP